VGDHLLTWWLVIDLLAGQNIIANIEILIDTLHESSEHLSYLSTKKIMSSF
jgi:hypothetical protein